jgi:hypothetical protein
MDKTDGNDRIVFEPQELFHEEGNDELNEFFQELANLIAQHEGHFPKKMLLEYFKIILEYQKELKHESLNTNSPINMAKLESMLAERRKLVHDLDIKGLVEDMERLQTEMEAVKKKKEYRQKGIRLRSYQQYSTTVMTTIGPVSYQRMALRPSFEEDRKKLREMGIEGYIFPLDDVLGFSKLPFKMTLDAMLIVAKEASRSESYEEAEKILKELTYITTNDDTIRAVTNTIGRLVHSNDMKKAEETWNQFNTGRLVFPERKKNHTLYLQCDGAMIATRPDSEDKDEPDEQAKGAIWKENKLGLAFSSDNIHYWIDKHGKRQHAINKREYTALIGNSEEFSKLMLSLAVRNGYGIYKNTILISDGATWIRNMKEIYFHDAIQILDFYHLSEHIYTFAKEIFNYDENKYIKWGRKIMDLFRNSKSEIVIEIIKKLPKHQRKRVNFNLLQYIDHNKNNIDYLAYRKAGYFIGSGAIESGNKIVLQRRMKRGGMRWNIDSGQAVLSLNAKRKSDRWADVVDLVYIHYAGAPPNFIKQRVASIFNGITGSFEA